MKRFFILLALLIALFAGSPAFAQTNITTTTLTNAITVPTVGRQVIVVGSATGITANSTFLYIDGSFYDVNLVNGTSITVTNTARPATHNASVTVYVVPIAAQVGLDPVGSCVRSTAGRPPQYANYTLLFNRDSGNIASCRLISGAFIWRITNPYSVNPSDNPPQTR